MAVMLLVIEFSRKYLPNHRGATRDTPLVLSSRIILKLMIWYMIWMLVGNIL